MESPAPAGFSRSRASSVRRGVATQVATREPELPAKDYNGCRDMPAAEADRVFAMLASNGSSKPFILRAVRVCGSWTPV